MTYDVYRMIFMIAAVCAVVFFVLAIIFFVVFKIPKVIGELSGLTAKKAIGQIQQRNQSDIVSGSLKGKKAGNTAKTGHTMAGLKMKTEKIGESANAKAGAPAEYSVETTVLQQDSMETTVLSQNGMGFNETTVLNPSMVQTQAGSVFQIVREITLIHTDEIIG